MSKTYIQIRNDENSIKTLAAGYKDRINHDLWLTDGLQKDAVQNSWDARIDKKHAKDWECSFELHKNIITITDRGTKGLNGTIFNNEDELNRILDEGKRGEDLAYFLNSDFSSKTAEESGNRGRGKTLFLYASKAKKVYFETMRESDSCYLAGKIFLDKKQAKFEIFDKKKEDQFKEKIKQIGPLREFGTRILIIEPEDSVVQAIKSGDFLRFISNSRWEIIKKFDAKISVSDGTKKEYAEVPYWYQDEINVQEYKLENSVIKDGTEYRIKRLVLRVDREVGIPPDLQGIAIQRDGMTIERLQMSSLVREEGVDEIYGWLEMEPKGDLQREMKEICEGPEHFSFSWVQKPANYLKVFMRSNVRDFAKDLKLIDPEQSKVNKIHKSAEERASKSLAQLFKQLGLIGGKKKGKFQKNKYKRGSDEEIRLSVVDLKFPNESRKVEYGDKILNTYVIPINQTETKFKVVIKIYVTRKDDGKEFLLEEKVLELQAGNNQKIGKEYFEIDKNLKKGEYSLRAKMTSLEETELKMKDGSRIEKGAKIYEKINYRFFIETEPPGFGPLDFDAEKNENKEFLLNWENDNNQGYRFSYNLLHPKIKQINDDVDKLSEYLIEQGTLIALQIKLEEQRAESTEDDIEFVELLKREEPVDVLPIIYKKYSKHLWEILEQ